MRTVLVAGLFVLTGACLVFAWGALENLWADYKDSPDSTYIEVGAIFLAIALASAATGAWLLRRR